MIDSRFPELKLQRLATVHLVLKLFHLPDIKFQLKWLLLSRDRKDYEKKLSSLLRRLSRKLDALKLSYLLHNNVLFALQSMTQRMVLYLKPIAWTLHKTTHPQSSPNLALELHVENFINNLKWTQQGTINSALTFNTLHNLQKLPQTPAMYLEVFNLCLEDCINDLWTQHSPPLALEDFKRKFIDELSIQHEEIIAAYFVFKFTMRSNELFFVFDRLFEGNLYPKGKNHFCEQTVEENMFRFAVYNGNFAAVKYFWRKLSRDERQRNLVKMVETSLLAAGKRNGWIGPMKIQDHDEYSDVAIFLIRKMRQWEFNELFVSGRKRDFLMIFGGYVNWPWHESFISIAENTLAFFDGEIFNYLAAGVLYKAWKHAEAFDCLNSSNKYFNYFRKIWGKSSLDLRKSSDVNYWRIFYFLGELKEFGMIREIYRDPEHRGRMRAAMDEGDRWFRVFYKRNTLALWWWFEEEVLVSDGEKRRFKSMICQVLMDNDKDELWEEYKVKGEERKKAIRELKCKK